MLFHQTSTSKYSKCQEPRQNIRRYNRGVSFPTIAGAMNHSSPQSVVSRNWFRKPCDCDTSNCVLSCEGSLLNDGIFIHYDIKEVNNVDVYFLESQTRVIISTAPGNFYELLLCLCQNECLLVIRNTLLPNCKSSQPCNSFH